MCNQRGQRPLILLRFETLEEEQLVLLDWTAKVFAGVSGLERPGIHSQTGGLGADVGFIPIPVVSRSAVRVVPALRHGVHTRADEVALSHVVGRDTDLHLLDRLERDWRDVGAVAGL